jgi:MFS transporter, ACS family, glucarate transporter
VSCGSDASEQLKGQKKMIDANGVNLPKVPDQPATRTRYWVVVFGMSLAVLSFIDRVSLAQAAPLISKSLHLTKAQMGSVFSAFLLSYALFEVPSAWFGDRVGARSGLLRIVTVWSLFTALTGLAWNFVSMVCVQFCFGMGDAGCFPLITKSFRSWLAPAERTRAQACLWIAARWGAAFTPLLVVAVLHYVNWRGAFVFFGSLAILWIVLFARWYSDDPQQHPGANDAEKRLLSSLSGVRAQRHSVEWSKLLRSRSILLLGLQYYFLSFSWYFYVTWLPTYLQEHHHLSAQRGAGYAVFPLFFCGLGSMFCGIVSPLVTRWTGSITRTRKLMACTGFLAAGCCLSLAAHMPTLNTTVALMAAGCFFNDLVIPHAWASSMDLGGPNAASSVAGVMNFMGNVAGISSSMLGGFLLQYTHNNWTLFLSILGAVYFLGVFCWPFIDTSRAFDDPAPQPAAAFRAAHAAE